MLLAKVERVDTRLANYRMCCSFVCPTVRKESSQRRIPTSSCLDYLLVYALHLVGYKFENAKFAIINTSRNYFIKCSSLFL